MDRKLLIILVLLAVYVFFTKPISSKLDFRRIELKNLDKAIAKEKFISNKIDQIKRLYPKEINIIRHNKKLFFSEEVSSSSAMSSMQQFLKALARRTGVRIMYMNWGVPEKKKGYIRLPISLFVRSEPKKVFMFVRGVLSGQKLMRFSMFSAFKYRNKGLNVRMVVVGFKLTKAED